MATELKLVEGWTGPIDETLRKGDGNPQDLTSMTVELILLRADGTAVDTSGDVSIYTDPGPPVVTAVDGIARYQPDAADLLAIDTPHTARWKVTDAGNRSVFFPSDDAEVWTVLPAAGIPLNDNALLTLGEMRHALSISGNAQDLYLAEFINAASDGVESWTGRRLKTRTYTDQYRRVDRSHVIDDENAWLGAQCPITTLTAVTINGTAQTTWMPGDPGTPSDFNVYVVDEDDPKHSRAKLFRPAGWSDGMLVKLTYTAGYGVTGFPIPGDLKQAIITLARDWYLLKDRQIQNVASRTVGGDSVAFINEALPRVCERFLSAYKRRLW